jgi:hypothetical protein
VSKKSAIKPALGLLLAGAALVAFPDPAIAAGSSYVINQCDAVGGLNPSHTGAYPYSDQDFNTSGSCTDPAGDYSMHIGNVSGGVDNGRHGTWTWTAPPAEGIIAVALQAKLRNDNGLHARVYVANASGIPTAIFAQGDDFGNWQGYTWGWGAPQARLVAELVCSTPNCAQSSVAKTWLRSINIRVADLADPTLQNVGGSMLAGGWVRGVQAVNAEGVDGQSGIALVHASIDGVPIGYQPGTCQRLPGTSLATQFDPCTSSLSMTGTGDTRGGPFHDGANTVRICAVDFGLNSSCRDETVNVDNTAPQVAFANAQDPRDPELLRAPVSDATSGADGGTISVRPEGATDWQTLSTQLVAGELQARVNSEGYPPGQYQFLAVAHDVAGNGTVSTTRQDGTPMTLTFPLKAATGLHAHLKPGASRKLRVGYGVSGGIAGRLTLANGAPLRNRKVVITESFAPGSVVAHRHFTVKTKRSGRFRAKLPPGPSRGVAVGFAGNPRYVGSLADAGRMVVRSHATFGTSRHRVLEGRRVAFRGRVLHYGARIPPSGKLVELQVKEGAHQWNTVQQAIHSNSKGRYHLHYRFGTFYRSNVEYRFRVKVDREQAWPYRAPVRSRARAVTVVAK